MPSESKPHLSTCDRLPDCGCRCWCHETIDSLVEAVQDECPTCGAYVLNPALHSDWHRTLREQLFKVGQYVPPPTYGGR